MTQSVAMVTLTVESLSFREKSGIQRGIRLAHPHSIYNLVNEIGRIYFSSRNKKSDSSQHLSSVYCILGDHNTQLILTTESIFLGTKIIISV